jgi:hypothetical protein
MKRLSNYQPDYTEDDLQSLVKEPRFLAAAHAYANGFIPLGLACDFGFGTPRSLDKIPSPAALTRLFHEVARRIAVGQISVSDELWQQHSECFQLYEKNGGNCLCGQPTLPSP